MKKHTALVVFLCCTLVSLINPALVYSVNSYMHKNSFSINYLLIDKGERINNNKIGDGIYKAAGDGPSNGDSLLLFAGNDTTVCLENFLVPVSGYEEGFYYTSWVTTGDGFFTNMTELSTFYFPSTSEISNGLATLYLVGICVEPEYYRAVDTVKVSIMLPPHCFAGVDASVCNGEQFQLDAEASSYTELFWSSTGDGTFGVTNTINPIYYHGSSDLNNGEVFLTLSANSITPCTLPVENTMTLSVLKTPQVDAGNDTVICVGSLLQLDANASDYDEILWTSSGDGAFSDPFSPSPQYQPGSFDVQSGGSTLEILATPEMPCDVFANDQLELTIVKNPIVFAGLNQTICDDQNVQCLAIVENYSELQWNALGGEGSFDNPAIPNPIYYPGQYEKNTGIAVLQILVEAISPCINQVNANFQLKIVENASVFLGEDQLICETDSAEVFGIAENYQALQWESGGDGVFLNSEALSTSYYPGELDIENGYAGLSLTALPISPCNLYASDSTEINIAKKAVIDAGADATVCENVELFGTSNYSSFFLWMTSGDGSFLNPENINTYYYPGTEDLNNHEVELTLLALSDEPCEEMVSDEIKLVFDRPSVVSYNLADQEILLGEPISLYFEATSVGEITYQWYNNNTPVSNSNTTSLNVDNSVPSNSGSYYCIYSNSFCEYSSDTAFITLFEPSFQTIQVQNGWSAVSSFLEPANNNIEFLLNPIIDELIIMFGEDGVFYPGEDFHTFNTWATSSGYIMKTESSDSLIFQGFIKYPLKDIYLSPGWSILPVNSNCPLSATAFLESNPEVSVIKEIGGIKICWPEKGIFTLENINPGKAYNVFNAADIEITATFPGCED